MRLLFIFLSILASFNSQLVAAGSLSQMRSGIYAEVICASPEEFSADSESAEEHIILCNDLKTEGRLTISAAALCSRFQTSRGTLDCYFAYMNAIDKRINQTTMSLNSHSKSIAKGLLEETKLYANKVCGFETDTIENTQMWRAEVIALSRLMCQLPIYENLMRVITFVAEDGS